MSSVPPHNHPHTKDYSKPAEFIHKKGWYQSQAAITEAPVTKEMITRFSNTEVIRMIHAVMGMATECGELMGNLKKYLFYGAYLDTTNMAEEVGDSLWYHALMANILEITLEDIQSTNIKKLKARFPEAFTQQDALNRDLDKERQILEGKDSEDGSPGEDAVGRLQQVVRQVLHDEFAQIINQMSK